MSEYRIELQWDNEADVWVATSPDCAGLVTTGTTMDEVARRVGVVIPGLHRPFEETDTVSLRILARELPRPKPLPQPLERGDGR